MLQKSAHLKFLAPALHHRPAHSSLWSPPRPWIHPSRSLPLESQTIHSLPALSPRRHSHKFQSPHNLLTPYFPWIHRNIPAPGYNSLLNTLDTQTMPCSHSHHQYMLPLPGFPAPIHQFRNHWSSWSLPAHSLSLMLQKSAHLKSSAPALHHPPAIPSL